MDNKKAIIQTVKQKWENIKDFLNERSKRIWTATEAKSLNRGGIEIVANSTGLHRHTIGRGIKEIELKQAQKLDTNRIRKKGGGRKKATFKDKDLIPDIQKLVKSGTRGDPENPLKRTSKSIQKISDELNKDKFRAGPNVVARILKNLGYSLQANRKVNEGGSHTDRNYQFEFINNKAKKFLDQKQPVISIDCKKKENIGNFKNNGQEYHKKKGKLLK